MMANALVITVGGTAATTEPFTVREGYPEYDDTTGRKLYIPSDLASKFDAPPREERAPAYHGDKERQEAPKGWVGLGNGLAFKQFRPRPPRVQVISHRIGSWRKYR